MDAFYNLEELEEACTIAWGLQKNISLFKMAVAVNSIV